MTEKASGAVFRLCGIALFALALGACSPQEVIGARWTTDAFVDHCYAASINVTKTELDGGRTQLVISCKTKPE